MSVLARKSVENNLESIKKQLASVGGENEELKSLEARLATEKDAFVKALIQEKVDRLKKQSKEPSQYAQYVNELKEVQKHLGAALGVMEKIPFYMVSSKGKAKKTTTKKK
jgi:DNA-binding transcriptional MerR regulator